MTRVELLLKIFKRPVEILGTRPIPLSQIFSLDRNGMFLLTWLFLSLLFPTSHPLHVEKQTSQSG